jgi:hypothetical protein
MNKYFIFSKKKYHPDHSRGHPIRPIGLPDFLRGHHGYSRNGGDPEKA